VIAAHPALGTLNEQERQVLLRWSRVRNLKRREAICRQGELVSAVFLVLDGYVKRSIPLADGDEVFLDIVGPGSCAGEICALQMRQHEVNITALSQCRLLMIDARQFRHAFEQRADGLRAIMRLAEERLQRTTEQLVDSRTRSAPIRLARALVYLAGLPCVTPGRSGFLPLRMSQCDLAAMTGLCREVVNRQLGGWRDAGWLLMSGGPVHWIDLRVFTRLLRDEGAINASGDGPGSIGGTVA
jgi:CRP-like cAMP-binding protein